MKIKAICFRQNAFCNWRIRSLYLIGNFNFEILLREKQDDHDATHAVSTEKKTTNQIVPDEAKSLLPWFL